MEQKPKIAVMGGGGRTGKYLVNQLVYQGYSLKLLLRSPENFTIESPFIETIKGDVLDAKVVHELLMDCHAVISTVGQRKDEPLVASHATSNVLEAMKANRLLRYILLAGLNVETPFDKKDPETRAATDWMKSNFPSIHADRQKTYSILSKSDVNWTLVRVPFIEFTDERNEMKVDLLDCPGKKINVGNIAAFLAEQLTDDRYFRKSPFIASI